MAKPHSTGKKWLTFLLNVFFVFLLTMNVARTQIPPRQPNIVLIVADDLGYNDLSINGGSIPTPHIDGIAEKGVHFSDAYVTAATCSPSRAGLLTGRYQQHYGAEFNVGPLKRAISQPIGLDVGATTVAEELRRGGYVTGLVGKWHLGMQPQFHPLQRGFGEFFGFLGGEHSYLPKSSAAEDKQLDNPILRGKQVVTEKAYLTETFAEEAVAFIERHQQQPFFLYVPFNAPHKPWEATEKYLKRFQSVQDKTQQTYMAMVSALDDAVGTILTTLTKTGLEKNTLVIFLSDNGALLDTGLPSNKPFRLGKAFLFEGGIRTPLMMQWPEKIAGGRILTESISSLALFPTICAAAGLELPTDLHLEGINLIPYLQGQQLLNDHQFLFWRNGPNRAIRRGKWKMILAGDHVWLFDLSADIGETRNLASRYPDLVKELTAALSQWETQLRSPAWPGRRLPEMPAVNIDGVEYEILI